MNKSVETKTFLVSILTSILIFNLYDSAFSGNYKNQFLFFLIPLLWPGVAHGSLDLIVAKRIGLISTSKSSALFVIIYLLLSFLIAYLWLKIPEISLSIFLMISVLHFGMSDSLLNVKNKIYILEIILRGFIPIVFPIFLFQDDVSEIFRLLFINSFFFINLTLIIDKLFYTLIILFVIFALILIKQNENQKKNILTELSSVIFCFYYFEPLVAFSIYFCFLHSLRHLCDEKRENKFSIFELLKKTLPFTISVLVMSIYVMFFVDIGVSNYKYISILFISLAALTVPHMILVCISKRRSI